MIKLDDFLVCHRCQTRAVDEKYQGEFGEAGYVCIECIRLLNEKAVEKWREQQK